MSRKARSFTGVINPRWLTAPATKPLILGSEEIHVWRCDLSNTAASSILSLDEQARAARCTNGLARARYITSRVFLRETLRQYLDLPADALQFAVAPGGKPYLDTARPTIEFNLSHTANLALLAIAERPIGVDVESASTRHNFRAIARRAFSADDVAKLASAVEPARTFIDLWTQLEARQKAFGEGIFGQRIMRTAVHSVSFVAEIGYSASVAVAHPNKTPVLQFFKSIVPS